MFKSLKDFIKKEEKGQITLDITDVPGWISEQMREIEASLERDTRDARKRIPESMRHLQELVEELQSLEHDPEIHPKLKKIAKNTLPLFEKAMQSNLKRSLKEEDPEEFYQSAVESLKGCVNATRAQGRYLQTVFPDQMKQIRTAIDHVGRDINTMTPIIAEMRKQKAKIGEVQSVYDRLITIIGDLSSVEQRYPLEEQRIKDIEVAISTHRSTIHGLENGEGYREVVQIRDEVHRLGHERGKVLTDLHAIESVILHIFDKGEKIATRSHDMPSSKQLQKITRYVPSSGEGEREELLNALESGVPVVMKMVNDGTIVLKNKEEKMIFSDPVRYIGEMRALLSRKDDIEASILSDEEHLRMHPLCKERDRLVQECQVLCETLEQESVLLKDDERRIAHARSTIPVETDQIGKLIQDISGKNVVLQVGSSRNDVTRSL